MGRRTAIRALLTLVLLVAGPAPALAATEYAVKAAFLYKFAAFVDWPEGAFNSSTSPLNLCIVGYDPFGEVLDRAIRGQRFGEHPIVARRLPRAHPDAGCHIVYVGGSRTQSAAEAVAVLKGAPVLVVTDQAMGSARGVIHFQLWENRIRFHIDETFAERNRVKISSKLLRLALSVRQRPAGNG